MRRFAKSDKIAAAIKIVTTGLINTDVIIATALFADLVNGYSFVGYVLRITNAIDTDDTVNKISS